MDSISAELSCTMKSVPDWFYTRDLDSHCCSQRIEMIGCEMDREGLFLSYQTHVSPWLENDLRLLLIANARVQSKRKLGTRKFVLQILPCRKLIPLS